MGSPRSSIDDAKPSEVIGAVLPLLVAELAVLYFVFLGPTGLAALEGPNTTGLEQGLLRFSGQLAITSLLLVFVLPAALIAGALSLASLFAWPNRANRLLQASAGLFGIGLVLFLPHLINLALAVNDVTPESALGYGVLAIGFVVLITVAYRRAGRSSHPPES